MAARQRDISVGEFFNKNRHLLGFDSPRKALLMTIKEAVDNSLDACEEADILPEIWVHIEQTGNNRYKVGIQDNGPGIVRKQIPKIFGKLLYGSKFHRLRMSRGQQGIGISAAGMYGVMTTGKPVKVTSKTSKRKPAHYFEIQINTKHNKPEILNGRGKGVDLPPGAKFQQALDKHGVEWVEVDHGTRVTIELEAKYQRGRGSVDEYIEQTAISNPHATLHYIDPDGNQRDIERVMEELPPESVEIKPHPYGIELGTLIHMLKQAHSTTLSRFLTSSFTRVSSGLAKSICKKAGLNTRANATRIGHREADALFQAIQETKIRAPATDCISPIGVEQLLRGLQNVVPAEFYAAESRPPAVYRGNPFLIEVALAYGGAPIVKKLSLEVLRELLSESDARTMRQFLMNTFDGVGSDGANKIIQEAELGTRVAPGRLKPKQIARLHHAMQHVNLSEGQSMNLLRYANRVPLLFQQGACAVTQAVAQTNWRPYGLSQSRGSLPHGPVTLMVHMASVWVPFTSESKEAVAAYPEILKEMRLALQGVGRKLGSFLKKRQQVRHEGERRNTFMRYLGEVAGAVHDISGADRDKLYQQLLQVAKKETKTADLKMDKFGRKIDNVEGLDLKEGIFIPKHEPEELLGGNGDDADEE